MRTREDLALTADRFTDKLYAIMGEEIELGATEVELFYCMLGMVIGESYALFDSDWEETIKVICKKMREDKPALRGEK